MVYWESAWQKSYSRWRIYIRPVHTMALAGLESQSTRPLEMRKGCLKVGCVEKVDSFQHNGITASIVTRAGKKIFSIFLPVNKLYTVVQPIKTHHLTHFDSPWGREGGLFNTVECTPSVRFVKFMRQS